MYGNTLSGILLPEFASLLQCFAYPPCMTNEPECVIPGDDEHDVIFDLFNHPGSAKDKNGTR